MKKDKQVIFRLDEELATHFKAICVISKRSQNEIVSEFIKQFVEKNKFVLRSSI